MIVFKNSMCFSKAYYNLISKEMHLILKTEELYVVKNVSLEEFNLFQTSCNPDKFFESEFLDKEIKSLSPSFKEIYTSNLKND